MGNAPHFIKPWPTLAQWLCGVLVHKDRNHSDGVRHYAYCIRCGRLFGNAWGSRPQKVEGQNPVLGEHCRESK